MLERIHGDRLASMEHSYLNVMDICVLLLGLTVGCLFNRIPSTNLKSAFHDKVRRGRSRICSDLHPYQRHQQGFLPFSRKLHTSQKRRKNEYFLCTNGRFVVLIHFGDQFRRISIIQLKESILFERVREN